MVPGKNRFAFVCSCFAFFVRRNGTHFKSLRYVPNWWLVLLVTLEPGMDISSIFQVWHRTIIKVARWP